VTGACTHDALNTLFFNDYILFKYCAAVKRPLPVGHLGFLPGPYSQSYPQNLWVSSFSIYSNGLKAYPKILSSIDPQASDPA
jgi:hypothetical protein